MKAWLAALMLALMTVSCSAADSCPDTAQHGDWDPACFAGSGPQRHVRPEHMSKLKFDNSGHALILLADKLELVAVDRRGVVVVPGIVYATDFDYPQPRGHLARFVAGDKCGYFDVRNFKVSVPAIYDECMSFRDGRGSVCVDCVAYCTDSDCHDKLFVDGKGYEIDAQAKVVRQFALPPLEQACPGKLPATLKPKGGSAAWLSCPDDPHSPFKMN